MISTTNTKDIYVGDGSTTRFPITFTFRDADVVKARIYDIDTGSETVLTSDYYVDTVAKEVKYPGYPPGEEPAKAEQPEVLPRGKKFIIYRETTTDQLENLGIKHPLYIIEKMIDKNTALIQEAQERLSRCVNVTIGSEANINDITIDAIYKSEQKAIVSASEAKASAESAKESADIASVSSESAQRSVREAAASERAARTEKESAHEYAERAESYAAAAFGASAPAWDAGATYNYPDVVAYTDGHTYRCIGHEVTGSDVPGKSGKWVQLTLDQENFENGYIMPKSDGEGSIGTEMQRWGKVCAKKVVADIAEMGAITPRTDGEGGLGTETQKWGKVCAKKVVADTIETHDRISVKGITVSGAEAAVKGENSSVETYYYGGTNNKDGAILGLRGKDFHGYGGGSEGSFVLVAVNADGEAAGALSGTSDGKLMWNGKRIDPDGASMNIPGGSIYIA